MRYGIGFKLALLLATFGIVAMGLVGYYSYASSRATLLAAAQRNLLTATQVLSQNLQASMAAVSRDARMLASLSLTRQVLAHPGRSSEVQGEARLADTFQALMAVQPEYFQIRLIRADQYGLEQVRVDRDGIQLIRVLGSSLQEKSHFPYVFNTLRLKPGQVYLSDITLNHEQGAHSGLNQPTVRVASPVLSAHGTELGLIVINLDLNRMFDRLRGDLPTTYQVYLSNHWGDFLIHPSAAAAFGFDAGRRVFMQDTFAPVAALIDGKSTQVVTNIESDAQHGGGLVAAFVRLPFGELADRNFVILGLSQPLQEVVRETSRLGRTTIQMIFSLAALALVLATLVSRLVTSPLKTMVRAVSDFSRAQVIHVLPTARQDEIGLLAHSLNEMQATIMANMRELNESRQALKHLAQHDVLTGLPNRALFNDRLAQAVSQAQRDRTRMALLFVDLDDFKAVNDSRGHHVGDLLLVEVARRMLDCVRHADTVGRIGGDEFVVLLPAIENANDARHVAEKIRDLLSQRFNLEGQALHITCSIGAANYPEHGSDAVALSKRADTAMYQAKKSGGNRVVMSDDG